MFISTIVIFVFSIIIVMCFVDAVASVHNDHLHNDEDGAMIVKVSILVILIAMSFITNDMLYFTSAVISAVLKPFVSKGFKSIKI